tara:strand:+ start:152 stop:523 length:372 start_codon:yes stop_codon:yes gene_type:complete
MKLIFSSISRLFFSYSKFLASLVFLSSIGTFAYSAEAYTYLKCDDRYYKLSGTYLRSNYNVRTKKFKYKVKIYAYTKDYIKFGYNKINRNTGEYKDKNGKVVCIMKKIAFKDLPQLEAEGKLF